MIYGVLAEIDYVYHNYEIALFMNEGSFKVATDILQLGLGMASTITNGERSKTVLSAVLTGFTGTTLSIDKNFFRQQTVQALISSMQAGRDRTKTMIIERLDESASSYPFQAARSDLAAYFYAGTLPAALQNLNQTAAANADVQRRILTGVSEKDVSDATKLRHAVAEAFATKNLDKVVELLKTMDVTVDASDMANVELTLPSECVSLNRPGFEDLIHPRHRRGGGNVGIGFIDFQGLWEGRKTAPSFSGLLG